MRGKVHKGVENPCVSINTILIFMVGYLHGTFTLEAYDNGPVVVIDEIGLRRLGLEAKPRDTIVDNEPAKPVVIIDDDEVRRFDMPTISSKGKETARLRSEKHNQHNAKPDNETVVRQAEFQGNMTKRSTRHCSTIFIHGRCPTDNASESDEVEKTFWVPENDIKYFGENTLDTTTLLNISEKFDSSASTNDVSGRQNIRKPISKPYIKMKSKVLDKFSRTSVSVRTHTPVKSTENKRKSSGNLTTLNDYKIGLYKISKITNNGNDSKNGRPLAVNISVSHPLPTSNMRMTQRTTFSLKKNVTFVEKKASTHLNKTFKVKGNVDISRIEKNSTTLGSNKVRPSNVNFSYPSRKTIILSNESNPTLFLNNGTRITNITSSDQDQTKAVPETRTKNRKPTQKRNAPAFYNITMVSEKERNATLHAFYDPSKLKASTHTKKTVTRTAVYKPLIPVVFKTVPNLVDTVLFKMNDMREAIPSSSITNMLIHSTSLNETTGKKKTNVPNPRSTVNDSTTDYSSNVTQTVRLVIPPSTPSDSHGNVAANLPIIGKTFQLKETLGVSNRFSKQGSNSFQAHNITDMSTAISSPKLNDDDMSSFFREKNRKTKTSISSQRPLTKKIKSKNITIIMENDRPIIRNSLSASDIEGVREELESLPIKTTNGNPPSSELPVNNGLEESGLKDLPDLLFRTRISVHDPATEEIDSMTKSLNDPNYDNDTVASGGLVALTKKETCEKSPTEYAIAEHIAGTNSTFNDIRENMNLTGTHVQANYAKPVDTERIANTMTIANNNSMKLTAGMIATNATANATKLSVKKLLGSLNTEQKIYPAVDKQRELSAFVKGNSTTFRNRLATFFSRQKLATEKNQTNARSLSLSSNTANNTINPTLATLGTKKSIMSAPMSNLAELEKIQNARIADLLHKFQNLSMKRIQPMVTKPVVLPKTFHPKLTKVLRKFKNSSLIRQIQTGIKQPHLPFHHALLIQFPVKPKVSSLNRARIKELYNSIVMKKLMSAPHEKSISLSPLSRGASTFQPIAGVISTDKTVKLLDMEKKVSVPLYRRKPAAKRLHPITPNTIKNLAKNLKQDILNVWPFPNYIKTPADVMLDQGLINRAKMTISTGKHLDDVFNRAVHGKDINIAYISSSLFRKTSVVSSKRHALLYNQALEFWFNKVVTPVTGSRMLQYKVEIPNVNEDYFSRCLRNHLPRPDTINLIIYELSEMDHLPNGKLLPSNKVYTENVIRNLLTYCSNPEIVMVDFYRGNTLNKGKYCRQLNQDTETKLANYYDCSFLSWSKSVCPYLRDDEEGFSFSYLFSGDKKHPSIIGHAQMAYILIDYIRDAFLKYMSRRHINPFYQRELLADAKQLPRPIFSDINTSLCYTTLKSLGNAQSPNNTALRILFIQPKDIERTGVRSNIIPKNMEASDVHSVIIRFVIPGKPNEVTSAIIGVLPYTSRPMLTMARIDDEPFVQLETRKVKRGRIMPLQSTISLKSGSHMVRFYSLDKRFDILAFTLDKKRTR